MSDNPTTCGNCQTENAPENDFCSNCGQPLTRSAETSIVESQAAQDSGSILSSPVDQPGRAATSHIPNSDTPVRDRLPTD